MPSSKPSRSAEIENAPAAPNEINNNQSKPRKASPPSPSSSASAGPKKPPPKSKPAPLPATIEARGYEITIPNVKTCWRVRVLHGCGHPVPGRLDEVGCHRPLVVDITRHLLRACTARCQVESMEHIAADLCEACARLPGGGKKKEEEGEEEEVPLDPAGGGGAGVMSRNTAVDGTNVFGRG